MHFNNNLAAMKKSNLYGALFGVAVGDALGVPVEFRSRQYLQNFPVTGMLGFGSHQQPAGTWSDDSSLTFCLAETLCKGYDLQDLANRFVNWKHHGYWAAHGKVFDIGIATSSAIYYLANGAQPTLAGGKEEDSNGNGSLMRILPLAFYVKDLSIENRFEHVKNVSSLTHAHIRSCMACFIYLEIAIELIKGADKWDAYKNGVKNAHQFLLNHPICSQVELDKFNRIFAGYQALDAAKPIHACTEDEIYSSGYVLHSLEAAIWCFLNFNGYTESVLKAVNLGEDTDTTAAITGGLAGLYHGFENIPDDWIKALAKTAEIEDLCVRFEKKYPV
jgi:ADP-ribosylglycohydrolase